jgi:hypothetical protein
MPGRQGRPVAPKRVHPVLLSLGVALALSACAGSAATPSPIPSSPPAIAPVATAGGAPSSAPTNAATLPPSATSAAPPSAAPTSAATAATTVTPAAPTASAAPSATPFPSVGNLANSATALSDVSSYEVSITLTGGSRPGTETLIVVRKPVFAESITATAGGKTTRLIVAGSSVWVDEGTGTFVKNTIPASALSAMTSAFDPGTFLHRVSASVPLSALQNLGVETKNGVQAIHVRADHSTAVPAGKATIPPGGTVDVWVSTDGQYLVALEESGIVSGTGPTGVKLEVTHINDSSLSVSAPG